ncbi:hypothetical protein ODU73_000852 [Thermoclostridium stercorarium]|nr:hypothetical protein [Thermoclostridium stercorarium]UZQ86410.1 hypothetical protein ODU73_000852 [Thermoclostridium stercorarium]
MIKKAKKVIMLIDSSKFNKVMAFTFAHLSDLDVLISDDKIPDYIVKKAEEAGVTVL